VNSVVSRIPVETGWGPGAYGIWGLLVLQAALLLGIVVKNGPKWLESWSAARRMGAEDDRIEADRKALVDAGLAARVAALEDRLSKMGQAVTFLMSAGTTTINALEAVEPGHPAIAQGRDLIGLAASALGGDDPFSKALNKLAGVKGVKE
jgi:aryl carrier-like protein